MKIHLYILSILFILANSCENNPQEFSDENLMGKWILISIKDSTQLIIKINPEKIPEAYLHFSIEGEISGHTSCNSVGGKYRTYRPNLIETSNLRWTEKACLELMIMEGKFLEGLWHASNYSISENSLTIRSSIDYELVFAKDN